MCFNRLRLLMLLTGLSCVPAAYAQQIVPANGWRLQISPQHCVTLEEGRTCYATVNVQWQAPAPADVCLVLAGEPLQCWRNLPTGSWQFEFAAAQSQTLTLQVGTEIIASQQLTVSWVQKRRGTKRHWRLF